MIWVALGTNIGDKVQNLDDALRRMEMAGIQILSISQYQETEPWGNVVQDSFLNAVAIVEFDGKAEELMRLLLQIELEMGRLRQQKWGPRLIDLDLIEFHHEIHDSDFLTLPHPYYTQRAFVLAPMTSLEPAYIPTGRDKTVSELLKEL